MPTTNDLAGEASEAALLARVLTNGQEYLPEAVARHLVQASFSEADKARMSDLATRNQQGPPLSRAEHDELMSYVMVGDLLSLLQVQARRSLRQKKAS